MIGRKNWLFQDILQKIDWRKFVIAHCAKFYRQKVRIFPFYCLLLPIFFTIIVMVIFWEVPHNVKPQNYASANFRNILRDTWKKWFSLIPDKPNEHVSKDPTFPILKVEVKSGLFSWGHSKLCFLCFPILKIKFLIFDKVSGCKDYVSFTTVARTV